MWTGHDGEEKRIKMTTLSDEQILCGFRDGNEQLTRQFFYGYCMMAYRLYDRRYGLSSKPGLDFYALAHDYYIYLYTHDWRPLEDRSPQVSLSTWLTNGFRYVVLDALKHYRHELGYMGDDSLPEVGVRDEAHSALTVQDIVNRICLDLDSERDVLIFKKILLEGYKEKEVADLLGISPSAVAQRFKKLRQKVRPYFEPKHSPKLGGRICKAARDYMAEDSMAETMAMPMPDFTFTHTYDMEKRRITPDFIKRLNPGEVFVFGSNLRGYHGGGAANIAVRNFGAVWGQGVGLQGQSYAIPTMQGGPETIKPYVDEFIAFAKEHPELQFLVTRIGCGIAGFDAEDIAPLFQQARLVDNISLPADFWMVIEG